MEERSWMLEELEPSVRRHAAQEAARRGLSLDDYLTEIVLQNALVDEFHGHGAPLLGGIDTPEASPEPLDEDFGVRPRLKALERRLGASVTTLDTALSALDSAVFDLTERLGDVEGLAGDSAQSLGERIKDLHTGLSALQERVAAAETSAAGETQAQRHAQAGIAAACDELEQRLESVESIARGADRAAAALAEAQHVFRLSVAEDLEALTRDTSGRLAAGLEQVRAAAREAAAEADAAAAHLVADLRTLRQSIDKRFADNAAETKARVHAAFAEIAERFSAVSERVAVSERQHERTAETVRAQLADIEDGAQTALEETALALRRADTALAGDIARMGEDGRVALETLRAELGQETADVRERVVSTANRVVQLESAAAASAIETNTLRESLERRLSAANAAMRDALSNVEIGCAEQIEAAAARVSEVEQDIAYVRRTLGAEINRVEACTLAALEQQTEDRKAGDTALQRALDAESRSQRGALDEFRERTDRELAALRAQHAAAHARLGLTDTEISRLRAKTDAVDKQSAERGRELDDALSALHNQHAAARARLDAADGEIAKLRARADVSEAQLADRTREREVAERLGRIEQTNADSDRALNLLRAHVAAVAKQSADQPGLLQKAIDDVHQRLGEQDAKMKAAAEQTQAVAHSVSRFTAENTDAAAQSMERLRKLEGALADFEDRQAEALETLHESITRFVAENDRRLAALEAADTALTAPFVAIEQRLARMEQRDVGADFAELRLQIEERVLDVEKRSVRALEQVSETVSLIESRLAPGDSGAARSA